MDARCQRDGDAGPFRRGYNGVLAVDGLHPAAEHVLAAEELGDVAVLRAGIDVARRPGLPDLALFHHHHEVGERDRLKLRVRNVNEGDAEVALHAAQLLAHLDTQVLIKRR